MLSHVVEFSCQYSEQVRKKQKVWHDGKLKHYQINNRFLLYTENDVLLSSTFVTSAKELKVYIDEENFGIVEHNIFGRYVVIIEEIISEYDREISHIKTTAAAAVTTTFISSNSTGVNNWQKEIQSVDNRNSITHHKSVNNAGYHSNKVILKGTTKNTIAKNVETSFPLSTPSYNTSKIIPKKPSVNMTKISSGTRHVELNETSGGFSTSNLALKVNKPFKPPKIVSNISMVSNRPNTRNSRVKKEIVDSSLIDIDIDNNNSDNDEDNKNSIIANDIRLLTIQNTIVPKDLIVTTSDEHIKQTNNNIFKESSAVKQRTSKINSTERPLFKTKIINHTPIILP